MFRDPLMNDESEQKHSRDDIYKSVSHLKLFVGIFVMIHLALAGGATWIYKVDASGIASERTIIEHSSRLTDLERRQIKAEAEAFTAKEAAALSAEIAGLKASNAEIYRTLQRIDSKIP
jgi:hypothetical protein